MRSRIQRQIFLPTKGNVVVKAAGAAFFNSGTNKYNLLPGQIGFYNSLTNISVDPTTILDASEVFIAIGVDKNPLALTSTSVRLAAGENLSGCRIDAATAERYRAGASNSAKFNFKCTDCSETYSIGIEINDPNLNFFYPENRYHVETITVQSEDCPTCEGDCDYTHDGAELEAKFIAAIEANEFLATYVDTVATDTPDAGYDFAFTVTFKGTSYECDGCFPSPENILNKYTKGRIQTTIESGWKPNTTLSTVDNSTLAIEEGSGAQLQWEEYLSEPGGTQFDSLNNTFETTGAPFYSQIGVSRSKNLLVNCETTYCQYSLTYHGSVKNEDANGQTFNPHFITTILVPTADTTTQTSLEAILNAFVTQGPCGRPNIDLECGSDTDSKDDTTVININ